MYKSNLEKVIEESKIDLTKKQFYSQAKSGWLIIFLYITIVSVVIKKYCYFFSNNSLNYSQNCEYFIQ